MTTLPLFSPSAISFMWDAWMVERREWFGGWGGGECSRGIVISRKERKGWRLGDGGMEGGIMGWKGEWWKGEGCDGKGMVG